MFFNKKKQNKIKFEIPDKNYFKLGGSSDCLNFYYKPLIGNFYKSRINKTLNLLENKVYISVLEVGYGSGILLPSLYKISEKLSGIDLDSDPKIVCESLKLLGVKCFLQNGDVKNTPYENNSFDLVVAISIFEHIKESELVVKEMFRILKPGGELLVGMPRVDKGMSKLFSLIGFKEIEDHYVTSYKQFIKEANKKFVLSDFSKMPSFLPVSFGLYFSMVFKKPF